MGCRILLYDLITTIKLYVPADLCRLSVCSVTVPHFCAGYRSDAVKSFYFYVHVQFPISQVCLGTLG